MSSCKNYKAPALKMSTDESLRLYLEERMPGGFDAKWLKPEVKSIFLRSRRVFDESRDR